VSLCDATACSTPSERCCQTAAPAAAAATDSLSVDPALSRTSSPGNVHRLAAASPADLGTPDSRRQVSDRRM